LFGFGQKESGSDSLAVQANGVKKKAQRVLSTAPRGVPTISNWKINRDGSVSGFIFGSPNFDEGESVTTSPLLDDALEGVVAQTGSGSRYFLDPKPSKVDSRKNSFDKKKKVAVSKVASADRGMTISLFGLGKDDQKQPSRVQPSPKVLSKKAPKGVPSIVDWRKNPDDSVSGIITGSLSFDEGERVTTSPILKGLIEPGETVQTGSGSRYFLV